MRYFVILYLLTALFLIDFVFHPCNLVKAASASNSSICATATENNGSCSSCLSLPEPCGWCKHELPKQVNTTNRCNTIAELRELGCIRISVKYEKPALCSEQGDDICGECHCHDGYVGDSCQCASDDKSYQELMNSCIQDGDDIPCSGRGKCICGKCVCKRRIRKEEQISGSYCECDNYSCPRRRGKLCNGRGECECGKCNCGTDFSGPACECPKSTTHCENVDGEICSGKGKCTCGICICKKGHGGLFCQIDKNKKILELLSTFSPLNSSISY